MSKVSFPQWNVENIVETLGNDVDMVEKKLSRIFVLKISEQNFFEKFRTIFFLVENLSKGL